MDDQTLLRFQRRLDRLESETVRLRIGTVTDDSPFEIQLGSSGVSHAAARLTSYTPTTNDRVAVLVQGNHLLVLGETV